jgi:hypothetical protein
VNRVIPSVDTPPVIGYPRPCRRYAEEKMRIVGATAAHLMPIAEADVADSNVIRNQI